MSMFDASGKYDPTQGLNFGLGTPAQAIDSSLGLNYGNLRGEFGDPAGFDFGMGNPAGGLGRTDGGFFGGNGKLGANLGTAQLGLAGLGTIGNLWAAFQAQSLAKKQFAYTKDITETNLGNQIQTYNTALSDRINSRAVTEGKTPAEAQAYLDKNSLSRHPNGG